MRRQGERESMSTDNKSMLILVILKKSSASFLISQLGIYHHLHDVFGMALTAFVDV